MPRCTEITHSIRKRDLEHRKEIAAVIRTVLEAAVLSNKNFKLTLGPIGKISKTTGCQQGLPY